MVVVWDNWKNPLPKPLPKPRATQDKVILDALEKSFLNLSLIFGVFWDKRVILVQKKNSF